MHKLNDWHQTKIGYLVFGLVEIVLAYAAVSWAIDSGRLLAYLLGIVFLIGGAQNIVKCIAKVVRHA